MRLFKLIIIGYLFGLVQLIISPYFSFFDVSPNLLLAFYIFLGTTLKSKGALYITFFIALGMDLFYPDLLGIGIISSLTITLIVQTYEKNFNKDKFLSVLMGVFFINLLYFFMYFLIKIFFADYSSNFFYKSLWFIFYNTLITQIFVYFLVLIDRLRIYIDA